MRPQALSLHRFFARLVFESRQNFILPLQAFSPRISVSPDFLVRSKGSALNTCIQKRVLSVPRAVYVQLCAMSALMVPEPVLSFGKYRGQSLSQVPAIYLKFLCCWENVRRDGKVSHQDLNVDREPHEIPQAQRYILSKQCPTMKLARQYALDTRLCLECFRPLVPIGTSRANGVWHNDWATRRYHKRCWTRIEESESETETD